MNSFKDYTNCKYFESEYTGGWHSDVYDHPNYTNYCTRTGEKRKLWCAGIQCNRCGEYSIGCLDNKEVHIYNNDGISW